MDFEYKDKRLPSVPALTSERKGFIHGDAPARPKQGEGGHVYIEGNLEANKGNVPSLLKGPIAGMPQSPQDEIDAVLDLGTEVLSANYWDNSQGVTDKSVTDPMIEARAKAAGRAVHVPETFGASKHSDKKWDSEAHDNDIVRWNGDLICTESVEGRWVENCKFVNPVGMGAPWNQSGKIESDLFT